MCRIFTKVGPLLLDGQEMYTAMIVIVRASSGCYKQVWEIKGRVEYVNPFVGYACVCTALCCKETGQQHKGGSKYPRLNLRVWKKKEKQSHHDACLIMERSDWLEYLIPAPSPCSVWCRDSKKKFRKPFTL